MQRRQGKCMILVVDDESASRTLLTEMLSAEGYEVCAADGGELALASLAVRRPNLILLDIRMPGMDGFEVCRRLKGNPDTRDIPLVFLTASVKPRERVVGLRLGAVDFVTKPFQREELLARVHTHLELGRLRAHLEQQVRERTAELQESEQRFRTMADAAPVMIWASGTDKLCTFFNRQWLDFTGRSIDEELGNGWAAGVHSEDSQGCYQTYSSSFDERRRYRMEYRLRAANGEYRWLLATGVPRFSETGTFIGFIGSCIDITDRKAAAEQLRALSASLISVQEDERRRISRELHDDLTQRLGFMAIDLGRLASLADPSQQSLRDELRFLQERAVQAAELTRHIAHELHPSILEDLGIVTALRGLCEDVARRDEIEIGFTSDVLPQALKREIASCLYAVAQEALLNISKHARAKRVLVKLAGVPGSIRLSIADDGVGLLRGLDGVDVGLGIVNMRERVHWAKGSFSIESEPGHGVRITVELPTPGTTYEAHAHFAG
jgi:PAS domain S-box-containing protein